MRQKINVPFLDFETIQNRAEEFRNRYSTTGSRAPVDVELLAELAGLNIIPVEQLLDDTGIDAVYMHATSDIFVDKSEF